MDDDITLPADTLAILNQFLAERKQRENDEENQMLNKTGKDAHFEEDWQLSQFWYSASTKQTIGDIVDKLKKEEGKSDFHIALLSCPSLYATIKNLHDYVHIFEFDERFSAYGTDFVHFDFNCGDNNEYLQIYHNQFDLIIADPPFLSEECITKMSKIIRNLQRCKESKIVFCSGAIVEPWLTASLPLHKCKFHPEHERNLGNEFVSYANFNLDDYVNK